GDLGMADMNEVEATRQIIKENPQTRVRILTIHDAQYLASEALRAGARGYVLKSDAGAELLEALESLRQNKPFFTAKVAELVLDGFKESQKATKAEGEFSRLTSPEAEIVKLLAEGKSSNEIPPTLGINL